MNPFALFVFFLISSLPIFAHAQESGQFLSLPPGLIGLASPQGRRLLHESQFAEAFWQLAQFYTSQPDLGSCSVASCVTVLNALPIKRPQSDALGQFRFFTPENFFTPAVEAIITRRQVSASGMSLTQLSRVLQTWPVAVQTVYASDGNLDAFRNLLRQSLAQPNHFLLVNYLRKILDQESGGHISPLGAYHERQDLVLILDTANYKYPWTWVKVEELWKAMAASVDPASGRSRGYISVSARE